VDEIEGGVEGNTKWHIGEIEISWTPLDN
jgi:hypothetical protein